jgi:hypothetical protein
MNAPTHWSVQAIERFCADDFESFEEKRRALIR